MKSLVVSWPTRYHTLQQGLQIRNTNNRDLLKKSLVVFSWLRRYIIPQQGLQIQKNRDIYKTNTNTSVKGLVVFSWKYIIPQQGIQIQKKRYLNKTNTNTSVKGLVVFSWPRRYIILHRANTGSVWAPLINLSSPQERFTNTNTNTKKIHKTKVPNTASGCLPLMNLSSHRETTKHAERSAASFRQKGCGGKSHHKHWATH